MGIPSLLFIGRPTPDKGLPDLLEALALLEDWPWHLRICGELLPDSQNSCVLPPWRASFLGPRPNSMIPQIIKCANLVVIPSRYENFCNVALETMAAGRAALGSRCGGIPDLIKPKLNGLLFDPASPLDLAAKLKSSLNRPDELIDWGINAFEMSREYGWEQVAERTHLFFMGIVAADQGTTRDPESG